MGNTLPRKDGGIECLRCGSRIEPDDKMFTVAANLETLKRDGTVDVSDSAAISSLCPICASVILTEGVVRHGLVQPRETDETLEMDDEEDRHHFIIGITEDGATLAVECTDTGIQFLLDCGDGISEAISQIFTWRQVVQMEILVDKNLFGDITVPVHQVFPKTLRELGFIIPGFQHK